MLLEVPPLLPERNGSQPAMDDIDLKARAFDAEHGALPTATPTGTPDGRPPEHHAPSPSADAGLDVPVIVLGAPSSVSPKASTAAAGTLVLGPSLALVDSEPPLVRTLEPFLISPADEAPSADAKDSVDTQASAPLVTAASGQGESNRAMDSSKGVLKSATPADLSSVPNSETVLGGDGNNLQHGAPSSALPPRSGAPTGATRKDEAMSDRKPSPRKALPRFYFPNGKGADEREAREWQGISAMFAKTLDARPDSHGLARDEMADLTLHVIGLPRFFGSLVFDRVVEMFAADTESSAMSLAESGRRAAASGMTTTNGNSGGSETALDATGSNGASSSEAEERGRNASKALGPTRDAGDGQHPVDVDPIGTVGGTQHRSFGGSGAVDEQELFNAALSGSGVSQDAQMRPANEHANANMSPDSTTPSAGATDAGTNSVAVGSRRAMAVDTVPIDSATTTVTEAQFREYYNKECRSRSREARMFHTLLGPEPQRDHLIPSDFKPLLRALLICHQGLAFLHATPEFQLRYSETVIERIYFSCSRTHNGRLFVTDVRRSRLLDTLMMVDEEEDINRERRYFSYEHFYVLYCRFWELDTDHDLQIDREDLMRYGGHSLTYRIVDRIFGGYARPLDNADHPGYMSYTDFIWFCLSEEDKNSETAVDYWYRCVDMDGDGLITMYDMEFFYKEQLHRMECFGHEPVQIRDILCQLLDMVKPNAKPPHVRRSDLKSCRLAGNFFNVLFNLNKFFALEARDPLQIRQEQATPELTDWDRFAALEYLRLSAEEEEGEEEAWEEVGDSANPLMVGEAPF
jgi:Ca2+-binding EF-hand superfamily protein